PSAPLSLHDALPISPCRPSPPNPEGLALFLPANRPPRSTRLRAAPFTPAVPLPKHDANRRFHLCARFPRAISQLAIWPNNYSKRSEEHTSELQSQSN